MRAIRYGATRTMLPQILERAFQSAMRAIRYGEGTEMFGRTVYGKVFQSAMRAIRYGEEKSKLWADFVSKFQSAMRAIRYGASQVCLRRRLRI